MEDSKSNYGSKTILLTDEMIESGKSINGGFSREQLKALRVYWPPKKGWKEKICGRPINYDDFRKFIELRDEHLRSATDSRYQFKTKFTNDPSFSARKKAAMAKYFAKKQEESMCLPIDSSMQYGSEESTHIADILRE